MWRAIVSEVVLTLVLGVGIYYVVQKLRWGTPKSDEKDDDNVA